MKDIKSILNVKSPREMVLLVLFLIYILVDIQVPKPFNNVIGSIYGNVVVSLMAIYLFLKHNKILGTLAIMSAYFLIKRSNPSLITPDFMSEKPRWKQFEKDNDFPITLEEEMVSQMAPLVKEEQNSDFEYKPVLNDLHEAASADYSDTM
jgi:hypothetical protein